MLDYAHPERLVTTAWVVRQLSKPEVRLVEVLWGDSPAFGLAAYDRGQIPGAVARDFENDLHDSEWRDVVDPLGFETLMSKSGVTAGTTIVLYSGLKALFTELGVTPDQTIITYCVRGGLSTHAWFVLTQLLGYRQVREYDRSWAEWGKLEGMPLERLS